MTITARRTYARRSAVTLAVAAILAIAGFTALGTIFDYPQILKRPTAEILALYRDHQAAISRWVAVLTISSARMAPAGIWLGRLAGGRRGGWIAATGTVAAVVQVIGLQRWVFLVPGISVQALDPAQQAAAEARFQLLHNVLGTAIGETAGYALTAAFTILTAAALHHTVLPTWLTITGYVAAGLIATGTLTPILPPVTVTNFAGYVLWCAWLLVVAWMLARHTGQESTRRAEQANAKGGHTAR